MYKLYIPKGFDIEQIDINNHNVKFKPLETGKSFVRDFERLLYTIDNKFFTGVCYKTNDKAFLDVLSLEKPYIKYVLDYLKFISNKDDYNLDIKVEFNLYNRNVHLNLKIYLENDFGKRNISYDELKSYMDYLNDCNNKNIDVNVFGFLNYITNDSNKRVSSTNNKITLLYDKKLDLSLLDFDFIKLGYSTKEEFLDNFDEEYILDYFNRGSDVASFIYKEDSETYTLFFGNKEKGADDYTRKNFKNSIDKTAYLDFDYERFFNYKTANIVKHFLEIAETLGEPYYLKQYFNDVNNEIIMVFYNKDKKEIFRSNELGYGLVNYLINSCVK